MGPWKKIGRNRPVLYRFRPHYLSVTDPFAAREPLYHLTYTMIIEVYAVIGLGKIIRQGRRQGGFHTHHYDYNSTYFFHSNKAVEHYRIQFPP